MFLFVCLAMETCDDDYETDGDEEMMFLTLDEAEEWVGAEAMDREDPTVPDFDTAVAATDLYGTSVTDVLVSTKKTGKSFKHWRYTHDYPNLSKSTCT